MMSLSFFVSGVRGGLPCAAVGAKPRWPLGASSVGEGFDPVLALRRCSEETVATDLRSSTSECNGRVIDRNAFSTNRRQYCPANVSAGRGEDLFPLDFEI